MDFFWTTEVPPDVNRRNTVSFDRITAHQSPDLRPPPPAPLTSERDADQRVRVPQVVGPLENATQHGRPLGQSLLLASDFTDR